MFQMAFVICLSVVSLALYFPPCRQLSDVVLNVDDANEETAMYLIRAYPQLYVAFRIILIISGLYTLRNQTPRIAA